MGWGLERRHRAGIDARASLASADWPQAEMFERQVAITAPVFASQDARESAAAFAEKRAPVWRGV